MSVMTGTAVGGTGPGHRTRSSGSWTAWLTGLLLLLGLAGAAGVGVAAPASAHALSTTAVLLDVGTESVTGQVQLPIDRLALAVEDPTLTATTVVEPEVLDRLRTYVQDNTAAAGDDGTAWTTTVSGGRVEQVDGVDHLVFDLSAVPPAGQVAQLDGFTLSYDAIVEHLLSHQILVSARAAGAADYTTVGLINWQDHTLAVDGFAPAASTSAAAAPSEAPGFLTAVHLGIEHITGGADHLLFLITLLLPAPVMAASGRWVRRSDLRRASWRVVHVVTAFAVGHSTTLALASLGYLDLNTRLVESLIAVSILAAAVHAIRPLVPGGEAVIAVGFGLVHGLAFAALIDDLGLGRGSLVLELLGFNLGIEVTQLLVVAMLMPSLLLLSRTRAYPVVRVAGASAAGVLAAVWLLERTSLVRTNPLNALTDAAVQHGLVIAAVLAAAAVLCWSLPQLRVQDPALQTPASGDAAGRGRLRGAPATQEPDPVAVTR